MTAEVRDARSSCAMPPTHAHVCGLQILLLNACSIHAASAAKNDLLHANTLDQLVRAGRRAGRRGAVGGGALLNFRDGWYRLRCM